MRDIFSKLTVLLLLADALAILLLELLAMRFYKLPFDAAVTSGTISFLIIAFIVVGCVRWIKSSEK